MGMDFLCSWDLGSGLSLSLNIYSYILVFDIFINDTYNIFFYDIIITNYSKRNIFQYYLFFLY